MDFNGHAGDIAGLSLSPDMNTYITGSVDKTAKLWDVREQVHKQMFFGHEMDVNSVCVSITYVFNICILNKIIFNHFRVPLQYYMISFDLKRKLTFKVCAHY